MSEAKTNPARVRKTLDDIVRYTLTLQEVVESTSYGQPALKRGSKLIFALRKDLETLAMVCGFEEREALMAAHPDAFFITDHYLNYPSVVVRLGTVDKTTLRKAVHAAWERIGSIGAKKGRTGSRTRRTTSRR